MSTTRGFMDAQGITFRAQWHQTVPGPASDSGSGCVHPHDMPGIKCATVTVAGVCTGIAQRVDHETDDKTMKNQRCAAGKGIPPATSVIQRGAVRWNTT